MIRTAFLCLFLTAIGGGLFTLFELRSGVRDHYYGTPDVAAEPAKVGMLDGASGLTPDKSVFDKPGRVGLARPRSAEGLLLDPRVIENTMQNELSRMGNDTGAHRLRVPAYRPDIGAGFVAAPRD